jgi:hypothetical protein
MYMHVYDPEPELEPEPYSNKMSEPEPSSNFPVPQPCIMESYSLLEPDACAASDGHGEMETVVYGEIVQMRQDKIIHSDLQMPGDQND